MASLWGRLTKQKKEQKFSDRSLVVATNSFSPDNRIGNYSRTYRGVLPNGTLIAVKMYNPESRHYCSVFQTTLEAMPEIQHPNIVTVIGYVEDGWRFFLAYEYMSNGNLYDLIRNKEKREAIFSWPMRVAVCNGIARALSHLHEKINPCLVHRNINPAKVFFDGNFTPKITVLDFVNNFSKPPFDYMDPEYMERGNCTPKCDVYGFGVLMLEIICGRTATSYDTGDESSANLVHWVWCLLKKDRVLEAVDPVLADFSVDQVLSFIHVALSCVKEESRLRPTMGEVIQMLNGVCYSHLTPFEFELQQPDTPYLSDVLASSSRSSMDSCSIVEGESSLEFTETESPAQVEVFEATETSATHSNAINTAQQQDTTITVSSSGNLVEIQSQT